MRQRVEYLWLCALWVVLAGVTGTEGVESSLASMGISGRLTYHAYANEGESNAVNRMMDFSYCGYGGGGTAIPDVPAAMIISPGTGDDTAAIQAAIDAVEAMMPDARGTRGAVLLKRGRYQVSRTLTIRTGGVVLRGEGPDGLGTVLEATTAADYDVISVGSGSASYSAQSGTVRAITAVYVPVGAKSFEVADATGYAVGDRIVVQRTPNQFWIDDLNVGQYGWTPDGYDIEHERTVAGIVGNTITVDAPLVDVIQNKYGGGRVYKPQPITRIGQCGVENLRIESCYAGNEDENHPWNAVRLRYVENCWVRRVTARYFAYACVNASNYARQCTIEDCAFLEPKSVITGGRRYSFNIESTATRILFLRCYSDHARHDFVTGSRTAGPNAFVDCYAHASYADAGPHHRWSTGILFDNVYTSNTLAVENRATSGSGHGWSGANVVFWNCRAIKQRCDAPKGAMNFAIGSTAAKAEGAWVPAEPFGWWEYQNAVVSPRSLYVQQLKDRLGAAAADAAMWPAEQEGRLWDDMAAWAGEWAFQPAPIDAATPSDEAMQAGQDVIFEVIPVWDNVLEYQWYEDVDGACRAVGIDAPTLIIRNAVAGDVGRRFFCRVVTACGPCMSRTAEITAAGPTRPAAPANMQATAGDRRISLNWDASGQEDIACYVVYRSAMPGDGFFRIAVELTDTAFVDEGLDTRPYYYVVRAVNTAGVMSGFSAEVSATATDETAPAPPWGLAAAADDGRVRLVWSGANAEVDFAGYCVYRSRRTGGGFSRLAAGIGLCAYDDADVLNERTYYYVVAAADERGNVSSVSNQVEVMPHAAQNVALGRPAEASSWYSTAAPEHAVDGEVRDYPYIWHSGRYDSDPEPRIRIDLEDTYALDRVMIYNRANAGTYHRNRDFDLDVLNEAGGMVWSNYDEDTGEGVLINEGDWMNGPAVIEYILPQVTTGQYVAVTKRSGLAGDAMTANIAEIEVYRRCVAPRPVTRLAADAAGGNVKLHWAEDADGMAASYTVYRCDVSGQGYAAIAADITATDYVDESARYGVVHYYVVTALDVDGHESGYSDEVPARRHLAADFDGNERVDLRDFGILAQQWLTDGANIRSADIAPDYGDAQVDLEDLHVLVSEWLRGN